jgi:hypothetical protein
MRNQVLLIGAITLCLGACTGAKASSVAKTDSTAQSASASTAAAPVAPNVITVHAKDFSFATPTQIPAGLTTINMINDGPGLHHVEMIRLDSGKTITDLEKAFALPASPPAWAVFTGGPNAVDPGKTSSATIDLLPGNYVMICLVDFPGGVPHFAKGMLMPVTVTAATAGPPAAAPTPDETITLTNYAFALSAPLTAGPHVFEVKNTADQPHEVAMIKLAPGKTAEQFLAFMAKPAGPPPASAVGGITPFTGGPTYFTADITPGNYALICFVPDAKDGKPHFMHGMTKTITVM